MIYICAVVFPVLSIGCGVVTVGALIRYVVDIRRDIRSSGHNEC